MHNLGGCLQQHLAQAPYEEHLLLLRPVLACVAKAKQVNDLQKTETELKKIQLRLMPLATAKLQHILAVMGYQLEQTDEAFRYRNRLIYFTSECLEDCVQMLSEAQLATKLGLEKLWSQKCTAYSDVVRKLQQHENKLPAFNMSAVERDERKQVLMQQQQTHVDALLRLLLMTAWALLPCQVSATLYILGKHSGPTQKATGMPQPSTALS